MQVGELTEHLIYTRVADIVEKKSPENAAVLRRVGEEERRHAAIWAAYTGFEAKPDLHKVRRTVLLARVFGFTFAMKKMESGEESAQKTYGRLFAEVPEAERICADEERHEQELLAMLDEERLHYVGSMVLGLNDALVELTGTLAGLTFAMQNNKLVALSGLITGASATLSMASSEYLSARSEGRQDALKSCVYTGIAYLGHRDAAGAALSAAARGRLSGLAAHHAADGGAHHRPASPITSRWPRGWRFAAASPRWQPSAWAWR